MLFAYLHLRAGTPATSQAVLENHIRRYAEREGYDLRAMHVGVEGESDLLRLRELLEDIDLSDARAVLIVGPARTALMALHRLSGLQVLTLADVMGARW